MPNITARDFPTILGINPYQTAWELLEEKVEKKHPFFGNKFTEHGNKYEDTGLYLYCNTTNNLLNDGVYNKKHPEYNWISGRPDGITNNNCLVEVKCPYNKKFRELSSVDDVPKHYWAQCQVYMEMLNIECCHYVEYHVRPGAKVDGSEGQITYIAITRDRKWWEESLPKIIAFKEEMDTYIEKGNLEEHCVRVKEKEWTKKLFLNK